MATDYYQTLGVDKKASKDEIKKAFRKLAQKYHPDKQGGDPQKFKEINEAYGVLSDDKKRAEYDSYGRVFSGSGGNQGGGAHGFDFNDFASQFGGARGQQGGFEDFDLGDIFGEFFGGGRGRGRTKRGRDIAIDVELSFKESVFGTQRKVLLTKNTSCDKCQGSGAEPGTEMETCSTCNGNGEVQEVKRSFIGSFQTVQTCQVCHGKGKTPKTRCGQCNGEGVARKEEEIAIDIPPGIEDGQMIRMNGAGEAIPGGQPGDLYIKVHVKPHETFRKEGDNLYMTLTVKLSDALLGSTYTVETLDGTIELKIPQGVSHGELLRVKGKGVAKEGRRRGDLLVKIQIELPKKLSKKAKQAIEELKQEGI